MYIYTKYYILNTHILEISKICTTKNILFSRILFEQINLFYK